MLDALRNFVRQLGAEETKHQFDDSDVRLALAALLIHCMAIDGVVDDTERAKLRHLISRNYDLSPQDLDQLIADAGAAERESVDLYRFTSVLKRHMTEEERIRVIEDLWEIVYADGTSHEFEENLVWRVAELLGVNRRDRIARKHAVQGNDSTKDA